MNNKEFYPPYQVQIALASGLVVFETFLKPKISKETMLLALDDIILHKKEDRLYIGCRTVLTKNIDSYGIVDFALPPKPDNSLYQTEKAIKEEQLKYWKMAVKEMGRGDEWKNKTDDSEDGNWTEDGWKAK